MRGTLLISHCRIPLRVCTHFTAKDIHMRQSKTVLAKLHALSQHPTGIAVEGIYTYVITPGSVFHSLLEFVILLYAAHCPKTGPSPTTGTVSIVSLFLLDWFALQCLLTSPAWHVYCSYCFSKDHLS